ncbi:hypothetical protein QYF36_011639 [Acer negundo]|nr:hypothetical protein QYF36_011639 [Acer negundo]
MIASKRYFGNDDGDHEEEESRRFQKAIGDFFYQMGLFYVSNTVPFLGWLDVVKGYTSKMKKTARELDYVLGNWVDEHHQRRLNRDASDHEEKDFIHVLLSAMDDDKISAHQDANTTINAICLASLNFSLNSKSVKDEIKLPVNGTNTSFYSFELIVLDWSKRIKGLHDQITKNNSRSKTRSSTPVENSEPRLTLEAKRKTMEFSLHLQEIIVFFAFLSAIIFLYMTINTTRRDKRRGRNPPEPAGAWPIVGHLPALGSNQLWEVAKECFTTNDKVFSTRPKFLAVKLMGYDHFMLGFAPYGSYWRDVRKLATVELLSNHRLELLKHVRDTETNSFIKELYAECVKNGGLVAVQMKERFGDLAMNIIVRMIADTIPFLGRLDVVNGYVSKMKKTARELDYVLGNWVDAHCQRRFNQNISEEDQDFIHVMLSAMDDGNISSKDANTVVKANCLKEVSRDLICASSAALNPGMAASRI